MRMVITGGVAIIALSTAALAQVAAPSLEPETSNNMVTIDPNTAANAMMARPSDNWIAMSGDTTDYSAAPGPEEPK